MERNNGDGELRQTPERGERLNISSIVIPADETQPLRRCEIGAVSLDDRQQLVGGYIEAVRLPQPPSSLYLNEEGKIAELPLNRRATLLLWMHHRALRYADYVAGDAFLTGPADAQGADTNVPDEFVATLLEARRFRTEVQTRDDPDWHGNSLTFDTWPEAYSYVLELGQRWTEVQDVRVRAEA